MRDVKSDYSTAEDTLSIDDLINENALRDNCKICLKLDSKEELINFFQTSLVNQRCLCCRFNRYGIKPYDYNIKSMNYSVFLSKIKSCLSFKLSNGFFEKNDFDVMENSKHIKAISVIHEIFYIARDVLDETNNKETINHMKRTMLYVKELVELLSEGRNIIIF